MRSPFRFPLTLFGFLGALALGSLWYYRNRTHLNYVYRLLHAKKMADQFYARYPHELKDLVFHPQWPNTRLDIYRPETGDNHPTLVYVYGGAWNSGEKALYATAAQMIVPRGVVMVVPDYTLYPHAGYPTQTEQVAAALAWTLENIEKYGGDPRRVTLVGQSAGGHLAALALFDPHWLEVYGHSANEVAGFLGISGVYDVHQQLMHERQHGRTGQYVVDVMGGVQNLGPASPLIFVRPGLPPTRLIHGDLDDTVPYTMSVTLHQRLLAAGVPCDFFTYPGGGHAEILFDALLGKPGSYLVEDIVNFVKSRQPRNNPQT